MGASVLVLGAVACGDSGGATSSSASASGSSGETVSTGEPGPTSTGQLPTGSATDTSQGSQSASETGSATDTSQGTTMSSATGTTGGTGTTSPVSATGTGTTGEPCEGAACCDPDVVYCGEVCCGAGEVCNFTKCEAPGSDCKEKADSPEDQYCELSLGEPVMMPDPNCMGGVIEATGKCLTKPPLCGPNDPPPDPNDPSCLQSCEYDPGGGFSPTLKFTWGGVVDPPYSSDIMMTPIVLETDDDDCDGKVSERDIPEILFSTFSNGAYGSNGVLHSISVVDGALVDKWSVPGVVNPTKQIAGGNFDGQPGNEVVACGVDGRVHAFKGEDGAPLWTSAVAMTCPCTAVGGPSTGVHGVVLRAKRRSGSLTPPGGGSTCTAWCSSSVRSCIAPFERSIIFAASARFLAASLSPSLLMMFARFSRSAAACRLMMRLRSSGTSIS